MKMKMNIMMKRKMMMKRKIMLIIMMIIMMLLLLLLMMMMMIMIMMSIMSDISFTSTNHSQRMIRTSSFASCRSSLAACFHSEYILSYIDMINTYML